MKVWYCHHSGVAVKTQRHLLLFDLFGEALEPKEGQGLQQGYFDPKEAEDQNTIVFVSHEHEDHFDPRIFSFRDKIKRIEYVLPEELDEIFSPAVFVHPHMQVNLPDCRITTLDSTDIGVAYLVETDGKLIYHAGDLNRWHWEGEEEAFNKDQELALSQGDGISCKAAGRQRDRPCFCSAGPASGRKLYFGIAGAALPCSGKAGGSHPFLGGFYGGPVFKGQRISDKDCDAQNEGRADSAGSNGQIRQGGTRRRYAVR